jgi:hypothetical protein
MILGVLTARRRLWELGRVLAVAPPVCAIKDAQVRAQWRLRRADLDAWINAQRAPMRPQK